MRKQHRSFVLCSLFLLFLTTTFSSGIYAQDDNSRRTREVLRIYSEDQDEYVVLLKIEESYFFFTHCKEICSPLHQKGIFEEDVQKVFYGEERENKIRKYSPYLLSFLALPFYYAVNSILKNKLGNNLFDWSANFFRSLGFENLTFPQVYLHGGIISLLGVLFFDFSKSLISPEKKKIVLVPLLQEMNSHKNYFVTKDFFLILDRVKELKK